uniref:Uncharacterized protein n=1 Tax=Parascaris univalens TaxID=6257 RepID=A0A915B924_PARUN
MVKPVDVIPITTSFASRIFICSRYCCNALNGCTCENYDQSV